MTAAVFLTVLMTAGEIFPVMMAALMLLAVMVTMVVAFGIRIIFKRPLGKRFRRSIR